MTWDLLIDETDLARLIPVEHRRFVAPVKEGLVVFLGGLPEERQAAILQRQLELPLDAPLAVRLGMLAVECPVLHKLGQVIARDRRIEPELRTELSKLESLPPSTPIAAIKQTLTEELGPLDQLGLRLTPPALAEASVAVVVPFTSTDGSIDGVFKVLKPGIHQRLEEELALLDSVGEHLDQQCQRLGIPELDYRNAFVQVREKVSCELRLDQEQQHLRAAGKFFANDPRVLAPAVLDYCTPRVTAMQRVYGCKVTDHQLACPGKTRKLAQLITQTLIARPLYARGQEALFHSDPHAGNLYLTTDGRLAILDWSLVGVLRETERQAMSQIVLGALMLRADKVVAALLSVAERPLANPTALQGVVDRALADLMRQGLPGMQWMVNLLDAAASRGGLQVSADVMLFRKSLLTLEGVLLDLGDVGFDQDQVMMREFLRRFGAEWPLRWVRLPDSRDLPTRLSNEDLTEAFASIPWSVGRRLATYAYDRAERCLEKLLPHQAAPPGQGATPSSLL